MIAFIGFTIAGELKLDGVENPQGMFIGAGIGGMFLLIGFLSIASRKRSRTWDGVAHYSNNLPTKNVHIRAV